MAKPKLNEVEVNASYDVFYNGFNKISLKSNSDDTWVYQGTSKQYQIVIKGHDFNADGKFITQGEISSIHLTAGKTDLFDIHYQKPLDASHFAGVNSVWGVIGVALQGNDHVVGSAGNDYILGGDGKDDLNPGNGYNYVIGGGGNDNIHSTDKGYDSILLDPYTDSDKVFNFDADGGAGSQDLIWAKASDCKIVDDGKDTRIELKGTNDELILVGIDHKQIDASDFLM